ncbi:tryptophan-rich sensory protein [Falsarthrobacter nasiphocae]|uniref:Uncharacterized protein YbjT (DUF2867 family)/tryptophan-rich sensory protein n=1 Tax=Falsarthrobacter nasiphocae TaxID=189863 RepID=A0AAE4C751_9MICC|nr:tryptophan-rich sensory protein [Falsarthrobacter nasiphocae]MDR6892179.1 uncharacterized protein YbjT (DUF2867 family)/tryptophan-rich sensory protein [Falsarthrobacter nasiphocae]
MAGQSHRTALVTGSTGYIGRNLVEELASHGWAVKAVTRSASKAEDQPWSTRIVRDHGAEQGPGPGAVEVVEADLSDAEALEEAMRGVDAAWFLVHSMASGGDFAREDHEMAEAFAAAAERAGVSRIVYLGGLHPDGVELSDHLASRVDVGEILLDSAVPTAALQAGVVVGDGSESFAMLRHLSERLPGSVGPAWMSNEITPISIRDVLFFLRAAADLPPEVNRAFDIGSPDTMPYSDMLRVYAQECLSVPRIAKTAPILNQRIAAWGIAFMTPVSQRMTVPLIGSLVHDTVVQERDLESLVGTPSGGLQGLREAIRLAVDGVDTGRWMRTVRRVGAGVALTAVTGSLLTDPDSAWYRGLRKPSWQPPSAAFPLVWTALYADIALVSALVIADAQEKGDDDAARRYIRRLTGNLILNAGWTGLFFRARKPWLAAGGAAVLAASSADLVRLAAQSSPERGAVLAPYAAWTAFATALSGWIARRN